MSHSVSNDVSELSTDKDLLLHPERERISISWGSSNSEGSKSESYKTHENLRNPVYRLGPFLSIHAALIIAYTTLFMYLVLAQQNKTLSRIYCTRPFLTCQDKSPVFGSPHADIRCLQAPARDSIFYTPKLVSVLYNDTSNLFLKAPSQELDHAWYTILRNMNIRITAEEMKNLGRDSIKLGDGSGDYLGALDVYHQLHCVKYLRYFVEGAPLPAMRVPPKDHANHCIELIRQILMCHGDIAVVTYDWLPDDRVPMPRWEVEHECVNWSKLDSWALDRHVSISQEGMIAHPELGPSYRGGESD